MFGTGKRTREALPVLQASDEVGVVTRIELVFDGAYNVQ